MAGGDTTPEQRLERLRGLLAGTRSDSRAARMAGQSEKTNVLFGAALHAADRLREGKTATDLERKLLEVLRSALSDQEIRDWGQVYRESVNQLGKLNAVPEVITSRPMASGYTFANLQADFAPVAQEHMARPNTALLDREALAAGGEPDSQAFINGMRQYGFGVTASLRTGPTGRSAPEAVEETGDGEEEQRAEPAEFRVKLEADSFRVVRVVGDQGGGKDEIYWCASSSSDMKSDSPVFHSEEFGAATVGGPYTFRASNRTLFEGPASKGVALGIYCWEADQSNSEWYDKLHKILNELNDRLFDTWQWQVGGAIGDGGLIGYVGEIVLLGIILMDHLRNEDDLSCARGLFMDQYELAVLSHRGTSDYHFNGDGHHVLKVKYTGEKVPFPTGTLEYAVRTGNTWGVPISMEWDSMTPPALASYNGKLYAAFVRPADKALMWTRLEGQVWRTPERIGGDRSYYAPALVAAHGKLFYAVTGLDGELYSRAFTESGGWATHWKFPDKYSPEFAPALAAYSNRVWLSHVGTDETIWLNTHDGQRWSGAYPNTLHWRVRNRVAMAPHSDLLWRVARGQDSVIYTSTSSGGPTWTARETMGGWKTTHGPCLAAHDSKLWIFFRGEGDGLLYTANRASQWSNTTLVSGQAAKPMDEPTAASHNNKLYVMYRRPTH